MAVEIKEAYRTDNPLHSALVEACFLLTAAPSIAQPLAPPKEVDSMMLRSALPFAAILPLLAFAACGGSTDSSGAQPGPSTGGGDDGGGTTQPADDAGAPNTGPDPIDPKYPTAHPALPLVDYNGGPVLHAAHIINITVDGDALRDRLESFSSTITQTAWWDAVRDGYCDKGGGCVGRGDAGDPVHLAATDFTSKAFTDSSQGGAATLQDWITSMISSGKFPAPTTDTLYAIYFPDDTYTVNLDNSNSCSEFGGYHNSYNYPGNGTIPASNVQYAVVPRCDATEATTTIAASHEYIEAATDPEVGAGTAFYMHDQLWSLAGGEVGDLCVSRNDTYTESGFTVQRSWSNKAAKASHDPCVPAPAGDVYFNVAPASEQTFAAVGASKTISLTAFSDAPLDDWSIQARDTTSQYTGGDPVLQFAMDKTTVNNGTKINLTITVLAQPPQEFGGYALFSISSKSGSTTHRWPGAVRVQ